MKSIIVSLMLAGLALPVLGVERVELDQRLQDLSHKFDVLQSQPEKRVPAEMLRKAQGIILLDLVKGGFGFAFQGGNGVAMARDPQSGEWSAPVFVKAHEGSFGFQAGGRKSFVVVLVMNAAEARKMSGGEFKFSGEASGTAGSNSGGAEGAIGSPEPLVRVYSDSEGLYGGVAVKGGDVVPDTNADVIYYGQSITADEILFNHKVKAGDMASALTRKFQPPAR